MLSTGLMLKTCNRSGRSDVQLQDELDHDPREKQKKD
jgi:hypothetical protein